MRPYKVNFELSAAGFAELNSQVYNKVDLVNNVKLMQLIMCIILFQC